MTENKATQERTPQERLQEEQEHKEHVHHTKINAAAIADHLLGNMHTLHVKLHQYHWYVKGANFFTLHEKFEELYNENEKWFDKLAERLIISGHKPASTTAEFEKYSMLSEDAVNKYAKAEDMVENIIEDFRSTRELTIRAIRLVQDEGDDALEDTLIAFKNDLDKNIWMLQAFIGKEALEDDDALDEDED